MNRPTRVTISSGSHRHYCILQNKVASEEDNGGGRTPKYEDVATFWGYIRPVQSYETSNTMAQKIAVSHIIETRFEGFPNVTGSMRIKHVNGNTNKARYFGVQGVVNVNERDHRLNIQATEQLGVN